MPPIDPVVYVYQPRAVQCVVTIVAIDHTYQTPVSWHPLAFMSALLTYRPVSRPNAVITQLKTAEYSAS